MYNNNKYKNQSGGYAKRSFSRGGGNRWGKSKKSNSGVDVSKYINKINKVEAEAQFTPVHTFADFAFVPELTKNIISKGYINPTPIQDGSIPHIIEGKDVVGIANTGTGKTAAFSLPLISKMAKNTRDSVLIITPTRELAFQIEEEIRSFTPGMRIFTACVVGGTSVFKQLEKLRRHHHFVIGTPGRLRDMIDRKVLKLENFSTLVLDEADRMLDMGFIDEMRFVVDKMKAREQTLFFSATLGNDIKNLIHDFLKDPVHISVRTRDTSQNVDQDVIVYNNRDEKMEKLHDYLIGEGKDKVLVFSRTKQDVDNLSEELARRGFKADSIHGDKSQYMRMRALKNFKAGQINILVATDVAARGLDISGVSHVVNYEIPENYDDYIHRIGRTGRADKLGSAITFVRADQISNY